MAEKNSLILQVKSDSVEKGADRLDHLTHSATQAGLSQKGLATATGISTTATTTNTAATLLNSGANHRQAVAVGGSASVLLGKAKATNAASTATNTYSASTKLATASTVAFGTALKYALGPAIGLVGSVVTLGKVVSISEDLEHALSGVSAVTGAVGDDLQRLEDVARELGATTVFSAKQAADGMQFLGMAGFETNEIIAAMPGLLDLAAAGQLDLAEASDIASNVLSGFRLEAAEAGRVGDVLAKGAASSNTSVTQLGNALSYAAPVAAALGKEVEETAAAIGVLSDNGIQGQRAGTGLRTVFASLSKVTPIAEVALKELGLSIADIDVQSQSLETVFRKLSEAGLDARSAFKIFGTEGAAAALALTSQIDNFTVLQESLENAEGAAGEMAITLSDDLSGSYKKLGSAASEFALQLDETIGASNLWRDAIDGITASLGDMSEALGGASSNGVPALNSLVRAYDSLVEAQNKNGFISALDRRAKESTLESLNAFSEIEVALARAENQLADLTATGTPRQTPIKKKLFEDPFTFEARQRAENLKAVAEYEASLTDEQRKEAANRIQAKQEEIQLLRELLEVQQRTATGAPDATGATESDPIANTVSKEFERLQRQLQTEEEAIIASYERRIEIIRENTTLGSALQLDLETRAAEEAEEAVVKIEQRKADSVTAIQRAQLQNFQQTTQLTAQLVGQVADLAQEGTEEQKVLFGVQKSIAIAQAIINTEAAASLALATSYVPYTQIPMATAIRALGYASVGVMAGTAIGSFATGGIIPGASYTGDNLTANVNSGEMILNGQQQKRLFDIADNRAPTGNGGVNIVVENYGSSEISVEQLSETDIRIIARDTAREVVRQDAPGVIATDLQSANSRTSKSLSQNTQTVRRR